MRVITTLATVATSAALALAALGVATAPAATGSTVSCKPVSAAHGSASGIRARSAGCRTGRGVARDFVSRSGCKLQRACRADGFKCVSAEDNPNVTHYPVTCADAPRRITFTADTPTSPPTASDDPGILGPLLSGS